VGVERAGASEGRAIDLARVSGCERDRLTVAKTPQANHHTADWTAGRSIHNAISSFTSSDGGRSIMVTWQSLSEQAEQLSWRDRLMLIWQLVRSLGKRSHNSARMTEPSVRIGTVIRQRRGLPKNVEIKGASRRTLRVIRAQSSKQQSPEAVGVLESSDVVITSHSESITAQSFFEQAAPWLGVVDGPSDLSTNPDYLDGYGQ